MEKKDLATQLLELLEPLAEKNGYEVLRVDVAGADHMPIVRVYLDREQGIDLDAVAEANTWLSEALESYDGLRGPFTLEASSPGIERPLRTRKHFERFCGSTAKIKSSRPVDGRSSFTGTIESVSDDAVIVDCEGKSYTIPLDAIRKANLKVEIDFQDEKGVPR